MCQHWAGDSAQGYGTQPVCCSSCSRPVCVHASTCMCVCSAQVLHQGGGSGAGALRPRSQRLCMWTLVDVASPKGNGNTQQHQRTPLCVVTPVHCAGAASGGARSTVPYRPSSANAHLMPHLRPMQVLQTSVCVCVLAVRRCHT